MSRIHEQVESLPDLITRCLTRQQQQFQAQQQQSAEAQSRNYLLRPESAAIAVNNPSSSSTQQQQPSSSAPTHILPHSKSVPTTSTLSSKNLQPLPPPAIPPRTSPQP